MTDTITDEAMEDACDAAVDEWISNAPMFVGRDVTIEERVRRAANAAVKQYLESSPAITELVNLVGLPEYNIRGDMADWIEAVANAVEALPREIPKSGLCSCGEFRLDRVSDDGTWEQVFTRPCSSCGSALYG